VSGNDRKKFCVKVCTKAHEYKIYISRKVIKLRVYCICEIIIQYKTNYKCKIHSYLKQQPSSIRIVDNKAT